jgi:transcriptional regulator with XRE-family HTH domain
MTTCESISELRRLSGLTWEQLGQLFGVSRRSVHFWASGKPLNAENERRLLLVLGIVRGAFQGDARATRSALLRGQEGTSAFDLLIKGQLDAARERLGSGALPLRPALPALSAEARAARMPPPPEELIEALHDRVHQEPGRARAARTVRIAKRQGIQGL